MKKKKDAEIGKFVVLYTGGERRPIACGQIIYPIKRVGRIITKRPSHYLVNPCSGKSSPKIQTGPWAIEFCKTFRKPEEAKKAFASKKSQAQA